MAKFKPARLKARRSAVPPQGGMACLVMILIGMVLVMLFLYLVMRNAS
jgi:hypothetical protein